MKWIVPLEPQRPSWRSMNWANPKEDKIMKAWKGTVLALVLGASFVFVSESPAGRRNASPCYSPPAPPKPPAAKDTVDLRWKFQANKPFYVEITTKTDQTMKVSGSGDVVHKQHQSTFLRMTP